MKRISVLFIAVSLFTSSCVGDASLWGQYLTPTAPSGMAFSAMTAPSATPTALGPFVQEVIPTETAVPSATSETFVTQEATATAPETTLTDVTPAPTILYYAQSGDWLPAVAKRFGVEVNEIASPKVLPTQGLLDPGTLLIIPDRRDKTAQYTSELQLIPDSEVVFSATALGFDISQYVKDAGGYLSTYREWLNHSEWTTGAGVIERSAFENSVNPRLLLAILDYESNWVRGKPESKFRTEYPLAYENFRNKGVFLQLAWAVDQLSHGYYGWRTGTLTEISFRDGNKLRIDPKLNAGTVGLMYLFSRQHSYNEWLRIMDQNGGFTSFYQNMFGDAWARADKIGPLFPPGINQPDMALPFEMRTAWVFTGGPHSAWEHDGPLAALDFAPANDKSGCVPTSTWILASTPGLVVRSGGGIVVVDLDGDGSEQTGWNILYLHVSNNARVAKGQWVDVNDHIGHASCEGGIATGTHLHLARKYNGEWIIADGPIPFVLDGWTAVAGDRPYQGKLIRGDSVITADVNGQSKALMYRDADGP